MRLWPDYPQKSLLQADGQLTLPMSCLFRGGTYTRTLFWVR